VKYLKNLSILRKMATNSSEKTEYYLVEKNEMENFMERCMLAVGTKPDHAKSLATCLIAGDYRGHFSHGLNRLDMYVRDVKAGTTASNEEPTIVKESGATALVNGNNLLGPVVGNFCMNLAMKKAKVIGIGMVVANKSNHFGIAGYYSMQALKENLIGLSFTNTSPLCYPTRSKTRTLGTNPISLAAPGKDNDSFVLDMATSSVAFGKVELNHRKDLPIPPSWGANKDGIATRKPEEVLKEGGLLPLGGDEESSGYKGYGLMFMVDILCGVLSGSRFGPNVRTWQTSEGEADLGQCFIAINPGNFADNFEDRLQSLMDHCRSMDPVEKDKPVLVAGDPEAIHMKKCDEANGISYHVNQITYAENLAKELNIPSLKYRLVA
jgi:LDH2 family malate/lactate/ureidoglycolate dehydrogenase